MATVDRVERLEARVSHLEADIPQVLEAHGNVLARLDAKIDQRFEAVERQLTDLRDDVRLVLSRLPGG